MKKRLLSKQTKELRKLGYTGGDRIGDLIEYLGDDLNKIERDYDSLHMEDGYEDRIYYEVFLKNCSFSSWSELVDALWEAVKYKLNGDGLIIK